MNAASIPTSDYLNLNEGPSPENPNNAVLDPAIIYTYGTAAAETITASDAYGAAGDDVLQGTSTGSYLYGGAGNDVITAVAGGATLSGGDGNDILHAVVGGNTIDGGTGDDILDYSGSTSAISFNLSSNPVVTGAGGTDLVQNVQTIIGTAYADTMGAAAAGSTLMGGAGADTLIGGAGNDVLVGGKDADTLTGGAGADTFLFNSGDSIAGGADTITDFQTGADKVDLSGVDPTTISLVRLGSGTVIFAVDPNGPQTVIYVNGVINGGDLLVNGVDPSVTLVAQDSGGVLIGGTGADRLVGGAGNDVLTGGLGADLLTGGAGADTFKYLTIDDSTHDARDIITDFQTGVDTLDLTAVAPTVVTLERYQGATYLFAQDGFGHQLELATLTDLNAGDIVTGGSAPGMTLIGDVGGDTLVGGSGADVIVGGGGADALYGGAGADTFKYLAPSDSTPQAYDIIHDFVTGADKVDLTALDPVNVSILHYNGGTFINGVGTNNAVFQIASIHDINAPDIIGLTSGGLHRRRQPRRHPHRRELRRDHCRRQRERRHHRRRRGRRPLRRRRRQCVQVPERRRFHVRGARHHPRLRHGNRQDRPHRRPRRSRQRQLWPGLHRHRQLPLRRHQRRRHERHADRGREPQPARHRHSLVIFRRR